MEKLFEVIESIIKDSCISEWNHGNFALSIGENLFVIFDNVDKTERFIYFYQKNLLVLIYEIR